MKKVLISLGAVLLFICVLHLALMLPGFYASADPAYSTAGDELHWKLDENGVLTIFGTGEMYDFGPEQAPWYAERSVIFAVAIE